MLRLVTVALLSVVGAEQLSGLSPSCGHLVTCVAEVKSNYDSCIKVGDKMRPYAKVSDHCDIEFWRLSMDLLTTQATGTDEYLQCLRTEPQVNATKAPFCKPLSSPTWTPDTYKYPIAVVNFFKRIERSVASFLKTYKHNDDSSYSTCFHDAIINTKRCYLPVTCCEIQSSCRRQLKMKGPAASLNAIFRDLRQFTNKCK